jgi:diguanylate cyclase (GGDEF)-like protein/PAS domain S-box-containing protein
LLEQSQVNSSSFTAKQPLTRSAWSQVDHPRAAKNVWPFLAAVLARIDDSRIWPFGVLTLTIAAVFIADLLLPQGLAAGVAYMLPVFISVYLPGRSLTMTIACICTLLIIIGYYCTVPSASYGMALVNGGLATGVIWACAFLSIKHKRLGQSLRETKDRLQAIIDTAAEAIIVIDEQGRIESFNRGAEKLFGYVGKEVMGKSISILMPPPHARTHDDYIARHLATGKARIIGRGREVIAKKSDGTHFPVRIAVNEVEVGGRRLFTGFLHDLSELHKIEKESLEDTTTGLPNRRAFDKLLSASLTRDTTSLLFIDVDKLKNINDELGHLRGDEALARAAKQIRSSLRSTEAGACARIGGDEFAVILPNTGDQIARRIAERIFDATQPALTEIHPQSGVSIGVATAAKGTTPAELLRLADEALYRAKEHRGRVSR